LQFIVDECESFHFRFLFEEFFVFADISRGIRNYLVLSRANKF